MGQAHAITFGIATLAWCAGCGVGGISSGGADGAPGEVDAGDGGGIPQSGVTVEFDILGPNGQPVSAGPLEFEEFTIVQLTMQLHTLQLIGDTAPSGDLVYQSHSMKCPGSPGVCRYGWDFPSKLDEGLPSSQGHQNGIP